MSFALEVVNNFASVCASYVHAQSAAQDRFTLEMDTRDLFKVCSYCIIGRPHIV